MQCTQNDFYPVQNISVNQCLFSFYNVFNSLLNLIYHPGENVFMRSNILHKAGKAAIDVDNYEYANMECYLQSMIYVLLHAD